MQLVGRGLCSGCNSNTGEKCHSVGSVKTPVNSLRCLVGLEKEEEEEGRDNSAVQGSRLQVLSFKGAVLPPSKSNNFGVITRCPGISSWKCFDSQA